MISRFANLSPPYLHSTLGLTYYFFTSICYPFVQGAIRRSRSGKLTDLISPTNQTVAVLLQPPGVNSSSVLSGSNAEYSRPPYHASLVALVALLALVLLFLIITMAMPMSLQNIVFWFCLRDNDQFNYIDVGLYKTRHSMYRKEVYSTEMRRQPGELAATNVSDPTGSSTPSTSAGTGGRKGGWFRGLKKKATFSTSSADRKHHLGKTDKKGGGKINKKSLVVTAPPPRIRTSGGDYSAGPSRSASVPDDWGAAIVDKDYSFLARHSLDVMASSLCSIPEEDSVVLEGTTSISPVTNYSTSVGGAGQRQDSGDYYDGSECCEVIYEDGCPSSFLQYSQEDQRDHNEQQHQHHMAGGLGCSEGMSKSDTHLFYSTSTSKETCLACVLGLTHQCQVFYQADNEFSIDQQQNQQLHDHQQSHNYYDQTTVNRSTNEKEERLLPEVATLAHHHSPVEERKVKKGVQFFNA